MHLPSGVFLVTNKTSHHVSKISSNQSNNPRTKLPKINPPVRTGGVIPNLGLRLTSLNLQKPLSSDLHTDRSAISTERSSSEGNLGCVPMSSKKILGTPPLPRIESLSISAASEVSLKTFGKLIYDQNRLVLIVEDLPSAAKLLIRSLSTALSLEGDYRTDRAGINGSFYRCVSKMDVEDLMRDESMKDRFAFIVLDNDLGKGAGNFGCEQALNLQNHFNRPIIFNSADYDQSRGLPEGVYVSVAAKGSVVPVLEAHIGYFNDSVSGLASNRLLL